MLCRIVAQMTFKVHCIEIMHHTQQQGVLIVNQAEGIGVKCYKKYCQLGNECHAIFSHLFSAAKAAQGVQMSVRPFVRSFVRPFVRIL